METSEENILPVQSREYTHEEVLNLRKKGITKPFDCAWSNWNQPMNLTPNHERIIYMAAQGKSPREINEQTDLTIPRIREVLSGELARVRLKEVQFELYGKNPQKKFSSLVADSIDTINNIMRDKSNTASVRRGCANDILDRALGKSIQQIEVRTSRLADLYGKMDEVFIEKNNNNIHDAEFREIKKDEIDEWIEKNYEKES